MTDDLPFLVPPDRPALGAKPRCRHAWGYPIGSWAAVAPCAVCGVRPLAHPGIGESPDHYWTNGPTQCQRCNKFRDAARSRRGRTNRNRGNAIEREVGKRLGLRRVGQYGGPDDLSGDLFSVQVKSGGAFPERLWTWLKAVPANAGQTPLLVVTDAPGPGHRRRAVVVIDIDSWVELHGPTGGDAA